ncbi:MAG: helicase-associated domain-containing protein [Planctomycetes bacterium]|nr:helicase-associated domain-containing protein [Planctomycetota bacterium]
MMLDEFLNQQKIETLQRFEFFWTDVHRGTTSKSKLLNKLRRAMLDPATLRARFQTLPSAERKLLEFLLHGADRTGAGGDLLQAGGGAATERICRLLRSLADKGLIHYRAGGSASDPAGQAGMPQELSQSLRLVLQGDVRAPDALLSLKGFSESLLPKRAAPAASRTRRDGRVETPSAVTPVTRLPLVQRLASLESRDLQAAVESALEDFMGLLPLSACRKRKPGLDADTLARWREQLEQSGLGTTGFVHLEHLGLNIRGEYLIVFLEVVADHLRSITADPDLDPKARVSSHGLELLLDFSLLLRWARQEELRLTRNDTLRKHDADETLAALLLARGKSPDAAQAYFRRLLLRASSLGLVERLPDGTLATTARAIEWNLGSLDKKVRELYPWFLELEEPLVQRGHMETLCGRLETWVRALIPGRWYPLEHAARLAVVQHLLALINDELDASRLALHSLHALPLGLDGLAQDFARWLQETPHELGIVDLAFSGKKTAAVRTSRMAGLLFGGGHVESPAPSPGLMVNADFELVLFPAEVPPSAHIFVHQMAVLEKVDKVFHYRIEEDAVISAAALGLSGEAMVRALEENGRGALPQNVRYSVLSWAGRVHHAGVEPAFLLELPSPELMEQVLTLPEIQHLVLRRIGPSLLALNTPLDDRSALRALQKLGIYLQRV